MNSLNPDPAIIALGVRQPWVELILRGVKSIEIRTRNTAVRGTIYLYVSKQPSVLPVAASTARYFELDMGQLPKGVVVGSVELVDARPAQPDDAASACLPATMLHGQFAWELRSPRRFSEPMPPHQIPYGTWFYPFNNGGRATS